MKFKLLAILLLLLILNSCQAATSTPDSKPLAKLFDNRCSLPCWQEIEIGQSTQQEAIEILKNIDFVGKIKVDENQPSIGYSRINWESKPEYKRSSGDILINEDKVVLITIVPGSKMLTLKQLFEIFGEPQSIVSTYSTTEQLHQSAYLFYPDLDAIATILQVNRGEKEKIQLSEKDDVFYISLLEKGKTFETLDRIKFVWAIDSSWLAKSERWTGFGTYSCYDLLKGAMPK